MKKIVKEQLVFNHFQQLVFSNFFLHFFKIDILVSVVLQSGGNQKDCPDNKFRCDDGSCITATWRCDRDGDCDDGSDEVNCTYSCRTDQFKCMQGECIPGTWQCDLTPDCPDGSDETDVCRKQTQIGFFNISDCSTILSLVSKNFKTF